MFYLDKIFLSIFSRWKLLELLRIVFNLVFLCLVKCSLDAFVCVSCLEIYGWMLLRCFCLCFKCLEFLHKRKIKLKTVLIASISILLCLCFKCLEFLHKIKIKLKTVLIAPISVLLSKLRNGMVSSQKVNAAMAY